MHQTIANWIYTSRRQNLTERFWKLRSANAEQFDNLEDQVAKWARDCSANLVWTKNRHDRSAFGS